MACRNGWRRLVLALALMLLALPALAGERVERRAERSLLGEVWAAFVRWVVPAGGWEKLGPEMDPNGLAGVTPPGDLDDLGPGMDPDG